MFNIRHAVHSHGHMEKSGEEKSRLLSFSAQRIFRAIAKLVLDAESLLVITCLCVSCCRKILFELFVKHFHHPRILHAVDNSVGSFLSFLLTQVLSFDDLRRSEMAFSCQPCEYSLVKIVTPVVKGVCHFCVGAAKSRTSQSQSKIETDAESRTFPGRKFLHLEYCCFHRPLNLPYRRPHPHHTQLSRAYRGCMVFQKR